MGLSINEGEGSVSNKITADRRLWLTADGDELVEDGDSRAATLWAIEGREVLADEADRLGYEPRPRDERSDHQADEEDEPTSEDEDEDADNVCPICGFEAKNAAGLAAHQRKHED